MNLSTKDTLEQSYKTIKDVKYDHLNNRFLNLEGELADPEVWLNNDKVGHINKEMQEIRAKLDKVALLKSHLENYQISQDIASYADGERILKDITSLYQEIKLEELFTGPLDKKDAIVSIHAGAGGIDAQDWSSMVLSMYQAFCKAQGLVCRVIEMSPGSEGGVKSATIEILGKVPGANPYGLMKEEAGVHRLVRVSPFNSGKTRETSFCLVEVIPDGIHEMVKLEELKDDDLKWDYYLSGGKGGQSVNTTYSAVRLTHIPTGIVVTCQNERSQQQNKEVALKHLKNKLSLKNLEKQKDLKDELRGEIHSPEWSNQIRNYVLHPYKLIKDVRSGYETSNVEEVITYGSLLPIIWSVKEKKLEQAKL
jgi:peptide chain release factor 2